MSNNQIQKKANVPTLRFPEFSGEWERRTIGRDCEINMCKRIFSSQTSETGDVPFYKIGTIGGEADAYIAQDLFEEYKSKYNFPEKGEVLISCAGTVGKTVIYDGRPAYFQDSNIVWISNPTKLYLNEFLQYVLSRVDWRKLNTTTIVRIYNDNLRELTINFPSTAEQQKIVGLLSKIDERIAIQNKVIERLQSLIRALTDKAFIDLTSGNMVNFEQLYSDAGEGGTPSTSNTEYYEGGTIPFIKIDDLSEKYLQRNKDFITETGLSKSSAWIIPSNSVIYSNGATIGAISINTYPVTTKQGILGIVPHASVSTEYLYYLMSSTYFRKEVERIITEGTMKTAYLKDINKIKCPLPNWETQQRISYSLALLSEKNDGERAALIAYERIKKSLLHSLFI